MKRFLTVSLIAACLFAGTRGLRPRYNAKDYQASDTANGVTVAADALDPEYVRHAFASAVHNGYLVVEVAVYPESGSSLDLVASDFALRVSGDPSPIRPVSAQTVAGVMHRKSNPQKPSSPSDINVYPRVGIGYEKGSYEDPVTGQRRNAGGWTTSTGVDVATGGSTQPAPPRPASTDQDRRTMQAELEDKGLPEGQVNRPVAGYLYFPIGKKKASPQSLEYYGQSGKLLIPFPASPKKKT